MVDDALVAEDGLQAARQLLASVLEMEAADIADDAGIGQLAGWDSLGHMRLIMAIESRYGATVVTRQRGGYWQPA